MVSISEIYRQPLALHTDFYQLTMAYGYWKAGLQDAESVFHVSFRRTPFSGGFSIACGLAPVIDFLREFRFDPTDLEYLAEQTGNDGERLFDPEFLDYLSGMRLSCTVDAIPEGTAVFPHEPLLRIRGPIAQCQLLETPILNLINFQTLIATKSARVSLAAKGDEILEFGLRRAQGIDGALAASRASYVGGCTATSNILAGKLFGIPVRGTHAHSWVMCFDEEETAFDTYAEAMPNNCVFLVDTYDTLEGVRRAARAGKRLRERGHEMVGIRLDSGDLAYLSQKAREILDAEGFPDAAIVASNDLDERLISSLKGQGATISVWGVGTRLITAYDQPALGGVYKLSAIRESGGEWRHTVKLSEQAVKVNIPGILQVRRFRNDDEYIGDLIYDELLGPGSGKRATLVDPFDFTRRKSIDANAPSEELLVPIFNEGTPVYESPPLPEIRDRTLRQLELFHQGIKRFTNPHEYPVGLEESLHELKTKLVLEARNPRDGE